MIERRERIALTAFLCRKAGKDELSIGTFSCPIVNFLFRFAKMDKKGEMDKTENEQV